MIIVLCRNAIQYTRLCLPTLLQQTANVPVLAVDNASSDGTPGWLRAQRVWRMSFGKVQSVAHCWNQALDYAWSRGCKRALVVNNDTELLPGTYETLDSYAAADPGIGMVTAVGVAAAPAYPREIAARLHPDYSCYMITRWAHQRIPFDEGYVGGYFEDSNHHVRLFRAGIWAGSINIGFLHRSSGTLKQASRREQARINANYAANKARFLEQFGCLPGTRGYEQLFSAHDHGQQTGEDPERQAGGNEGGIVGRWGGPPAAGGAQAKENECKHQTD
jgi:glycosyltransferase involved in cell wall biosynthesis